MCSALSSSGSWGWWLLRPTVPACHRPLRSSPHRLCPIPALIPVLDEAGSLCPGISAPLLAAQIDAESGWNPSAVSPAGAEGIAQFLPATFATYARNDDGTGNVSPFNPVDAVMAMGRYDCALLADVSGLTGQTPVSLMLAAYNAGVGAVLAFQGIPPYPETEAYVGRGGVTRSDLHSLPQLGLPFLLVWTTVVAAATGELGVPYSWGGGNASGPTVGIASGANTIGFDCSGLVLFAVAQASGGQIVLPHSSELQATMGTPVAPADIQPGDVIAFALGAEPDRLRPHRHLHRQQRDDRRPRHGRCRSGGHAQLLLAGRAFGDPELRMKRSVAMVLLCAPRRNRNRVFHGADAPGHTQRPPDQSDHVDRHPSDGEGGFPLPRPRRRSPLRHRGGDCGGRGNLDPQHHRRCRVVRG